MRLLVQTTGSPLLGYYYGGRQPHVYLEVATASTVAGGPPYSELVSLIAERITVKVHVRLSPRRDEVALQRQARGYPPGDVAHDAEGVGKALLEARNPGDRLPAGVRGAAENERLETDYLLHVEEPSLVTSDR